MTRLGWFGVVLSLVYLLFIALFQWERLSAIGTLELNNFGDFLAGAFGPLAIFWLVLGFFQQGSELRNSVETLKLQAEELKKSVQAQSDLVEVSRQQLDQDRRILLRELASKKFSLQPQLSVEFRHASSSGRGTKYHLNVTNTGNRASSVRIRLILNSNEVWNGRQESFDTSESIEYRTEYLTNEVELVEVTISYIDAEDHEICVTKQLEIDHTVAGRGRWFIRIDPSTLDLAEGLHEEIMGAQ